ncbi:MAG: hypothetical protein ACT6QM_05890 [Brevundimonas mediterranea]|uniref:hypothetical protein n=1 Tax=Brevundimonas mediterranea TaxID=74329 RepID=UPI004034068F
MINVSYLRDVYFSKRLDRMTLHQSKITDWRVDQTWPEFVTDFLATATYPKPSASKYECFGWTPTVFFPSINDRGEEGVWRDSRFVDDHVTLFIADMDNQHADRTMIDMDDLDYLLRSLGLNHVLYASFTNTPERPKVRIVCPITRPMTPDEAFKVFTWFNHALDYQLDGAVMDPGDHLYGPPQGVEVRTETALGVLDVDHFLTLADGLSEEAKTFVKRGGGNHSARATPEQVAQAMRMAAIQEPSREDISIDNPAVFSPSWKTLLDECYMGGSKSRTLRGLCAKAWVKGQGNLTKGDLWTLYREMDATMGGYCLRKYGFAACDRDIVSAMSAIGSDTTITDPDQARVERDKEHNARLEKEMARLARRA